MYTYHIYTYKGFERSQGSHIAIAVLCGPKDSAMMADVLQLLRYEG